jgi:hypothetical protein
MGEFLYSEPRKSSLLWAFLEYYQLCFDRRDNNRSNNIYPQDCRLADFVAKQSAGAVSNSKQELWR